jgi:hypothetical protein
MTETEWPQFNEYHISFFEDVIAMAKKVGSMDILLPCKDDSLRTHKLW